MKKRCALRFRLKNENKFTFSKKNDSFAALKKIISIAILFVYVITCTEFAQLLRVPILVSHFFEHKEEDEGISFGEFMLIHYVAEYGEDDYQQDTHLPFKAVDGNTIQIIAFVPFLSSCLKAKPIYAKVQKYDPYVDGFIDNAYLSSIWQPPKLS